MAASRSLQSLLLPNSLSTGYSLVLLVGVSLNSVLLCCSHLRSSLKEDGGGGRGPVGKVLVVQVPSTHIQILMGLPASGLTALGGSRRRDPPPSYPFLGVGGVDSSSLPLSDLSCSL